MGVGRLPGRVRFPAGLPAQPATPVEGEAGGRGDGSCSTTRLAPSTPGEGEARRGGEESDTGGGVDDRLICCASPLLPPPPRLGGGGSASRGGARVRLLARRGEVRTPWWLAANCGG
jgi:hypothetical protein